MTNINTENNIMLENLIRCNLDLLNYLTHYNGLVLNLLIEYEDYASKNSYKTEDGYFYISILKIANTLSTSCVDVSNILNGLQKVQLITLRQYTNEKDYLVKINEKNVIDFVRSAKSNNFRRDWMFDIDKIFAQGCIAKKLEQHREE